MKNISNSSFEKKLIILIFLLSLSFMHYLYGISFTTMDDLWFSLLSLHNGLYAETVQWALDQGRFQYFFVTPILQISHIIESAFYYNIWTFIGFITISSSLVYFISYFLKNRFIGILCMIYLLALYQNGWGHNLITSYSFYIWFSLSTFIISMIYLDKYIKTKSNKTFYLYNILVFYSFSNESIVLFFILFSFYIISENWGLLKNKKIKSLIFIYGSLIIYLIVYFSFKMFGATELSYEGTNLNLDVMAIFKTLWQYSISGIPGYYFLDGTYTNIISNFQEDMPYNYFDILLLSIGITGVIKVIAIIFSSYVIAYKLRKNLNFLINNKSTMNMGLFLISFVFASNFLVALTPKYQAWVIKYEDVSYTSSSFSFIGFILLFIIIFILITKINKEFYFKITLVLYITSISLLSLFTSYTNFYLKLDQIQSTQKWILVDKMIDSKAFKGIPPLSNILGTSLISNVHGILNTDDRYWTSYINIKTGHGKDSRGILIKTEDIDKSNYTIRYDESSIKNVRAYLLLEDKINNTIYGYFSDSIRNYQIVGKAENDSTIKIFINERLIFTTYTRDGIFEVENININKNDILKISYSSKIIENSLIFNASTVKSNFSGVKYIYYKGFYKDEGTHRWSGPNNKSVIKINNRSKNNVITSLSFSISSLRKKKVNIYINNKLIETLHIDKINKKYDIILKHLVLNKGTNYLEFDDLIGTMSPQNSSDTRKLGFSISNFMQLNIK